MHADGVAGFEDFSLDSLIKRIRLKEMIPKAQLFPSVSIFELGENLWKQLNLLQKIFLPFLILIS